MFHGRFILLAALAIFLVSLAVAALAEPEVSDLIAKLIELKKKNIAEDKIIEALGQTLRGPVPLTEDDLARLRAAGVGEQIILELVDRRPRNPRPSANTGNCDKNCLIASLDEQVSCERDKYLCFQDCRPYLSGDDGSAFTACERECAERWVAVNYVKCIEACNGCAWDLNQCLAARPYDYENYKQCLQIYVACSGFDMDCNNLCNDKRNACAQGCERQDSDGYYHTDIECYLPCFRSFMECSFACLPG